MNIGEKVRVIRELRGYSQEYMSIQLDVSQTTYSRIENETTKIHLPRLIGISKILDITLVNLLQFETNRLEGLSGEKQNEYQSNSNTQSHYEVRLNTLEAKINYIQELIVSRNQQSLSS
jgi:transcriptional regulator with XRE-family HTH domain